VANRAFLAEICSCSPTLEFAMKIWDCTVLVTGANRGIGRALVAALLDAGARKVYATARDPKKLPRIEGADAARVAPLTLDVTKAADISAAAGAASDVTLLINNAGVVELGDAAETSSDSIRRVFDVNVLGVLETARAFAPVIEANGGGAIANVVSVAAFASMPGFAAYCASKAAVWSLTQGLRASLATKGVAVHAIFPGPIDTDMAAGVSWDKTSAEDCARAILAGIEAGAEDIFPDPTALRIADAWKRDPKGVEKEFVALSL
jgi:NAD(P)-dependent dehydrogenase (short-subunit alcohol dehydrogenase family)